MISIYVKSHLQRMVWLIHVNYVRIPRVLYKLIDFNRPPSSHMWNQDYEICFQTYFCVYTFFLSSLFSTSCSPAASLYFPFHRLLVYFLGEYLNRKEEREKVLQGQQLCLYFPISSLSWTFLVIVLLEKVESFYSLSFSLFAVVVSHGYSIIQIQKAHL